MRDTKDFFCSDLAREYEVPIIGTATRGDIWFLVEYNGTWGAKAFEESDIPQAVKHFLSDFAVAGKRVRILLIRRDRSKYHKGINFFVGLTSEREPRLYEFHLDEYDEILNLDLTGLLSGGGGDSAHLRAEPLFLVCTNGRRDKCCALYGPNVYQELVEEAGDEVWQSSHIGGHNQAPIMLFFPHGVNYGRTTPAETREVVSEYQRGRVVLDHYRGRVGLENHLQAVEHFWREKTGVLELPGMKIETVSQLDDDQWVVGVSGNNGVVEQIQIERRRTDFSIPITCTMKKESPIVSFHRVG